MRAALCVAVLLLTGCLDNDPLPGDQSTFLAQQRDFATYTQWRTYDLGPGSHLGAETADRVVYINRVPSPTATAFPVGTIVVKVTKVGTAPSGWTVHGMVKRGGTFNANGTLAWEWFDLQLDANGTPLVLWRGAEPPTNHGYGDPITGEVQSCNDCHGDPSMARDGVIDLPLLDLLARVTSDGGVVARRDAGGSVDASVSVDAGPLLDDTGAPDSAVGDAGSALDAGASLDAGAAPGDGGADQ